MANGIWQKIYDWIGNLKTPKWLVALLQVVQDALIQVLAQVGKDLISQIEAKIVEVDGSSKSNREKFMVVFNFTKTLIPGIKDSIANLLIEMLFQKFKQSGYTS